MKNKSFNIDEQSSNNFVRCFENKTAFNIIIPIYKSLTACDKLSISSLIKSTMCKGELKYPVYVITPEYNKNTIFNDFNNYIKESFNISITQDRFISFDDKYFTSVAAYSKLLLKSYFYKTFYNLGFEYSYIFQLDCYLFRDELLYWINLGYDYIGAPILATNSDWGENSSNIDYVGNGGFSLRNNKTFITVLDQDGIYKDVYNKYKEILFNTRLPKNSDKCYIDFEDIYICKLLAKYIKIRIPSANVASKFAWDRNPWCVQQKYNVELPMCCHNWILFSQWYKKDIIKEIELNKDIKEYCENVIENFKNADHPELTGYGN